MACFRVQVSDQVQATGYGQVIRLRRLILTMGSHNMHALQGQYQYQYVLPASGSMHHCSRPELLAQSQQVADPQGQARTVVTATCVPPRRTSTKFDPQGLYPCSFECAALPSPCPICLDINRSPTSDRDCSATNLLPRKPLRLIYFFHKYSSVPNH